MTSVANLQSGTETSEIDTRRKMSGGGKMKDKKVPTTSHYVQYIARPVQLPLSRDEDSKRGYFPFFTSLTQKHLQFK